MSPGTPVSAPGAKKARVSLWPALRTAEPGQGRVQRASAGMLDRGRVAALPPVAALRHFGPVGRGPRYLGPGGDLEPLSNAEAGSVMGRGYAGATGVCLSSKDGSWVDDRVVMT